MKANNKNSADYSKPIPDNLDSGISIENTIWKQMKRWRSQFIVSWAVVALVILILVKHILHLSNFLFGAPSTSINWEEIGFDLGTVFLVIFISILLLNAIEAKRKRAEEAFRDSKERFRTLFESTREGWVTVDPEGRILSVNPATAKMLGYQRPEDLVGMYTAEFYVDEEQRKAVLKELKEKDYVEDFEILCKKKDGTYAHLLASITTQRDKEGNILRTNGTFRDITERKKVEETLKEERRRLFSVLDIMPTFVYLQAPDYSVRFTNRKFRELFGDPGDRPCYEAFYGRKEPCDPCITLQVLKTRAPQTWEWTSQDGRTYMIYEDLFPAGGDEDLVLEVGTDITELKKAEEERIQHTKNIESLSKAAMGLVELQAENDIYRFIGGQLRELIGDAIYILVNSFDQKTRKIQARALLGDDQHLQIVSKTLGTDPTGMSFVVSDEAWNGLISGKIVRVPGGVHELSFGEISKTACEALEKLAGIGDIFVMGFTKKRELYGSATIIMREGCELRNWEVVETFIHQAGVALQRKRTEEALRESEEKYRSFVERANDGIAIIQDLKLKYVNLSLAEMLGYTVREMTGTKATDYTHPDERPKLVNTYKKRMAGEDVPNVYETVLLSKDGKNVYVEINVGLISYKGKPASLVIYRDITERKRAEEEMQRISGLNQAVIDDAPIGIIAFDREGRITRLNRRHLEIDRSTSLDPKRFIGYNIFEHPAVIANRIVEPLRKILDGESFDIEIDKFHTLTAEISVRIKGVPLTRGNGEVIGGLVMDEDITERKRAEEALRNSEERFRTLYENAPIGIYRTTPDGRILMANPTLIQMLGFSSFDELALRNLEKEGFEPGYPRSYFKKLIEREGEVKGLESAWIRRDNSVVFVRENAKAFRGEDGTVLYYEGTVEDITERKMMEAQLIQAERLSAVGTLAYGIAHEFNNILAGILGNAEFGMECSDPKETKECFKIIMEGCDRAKNITNSLLAFSRKRETKRERADVTEAVETVLGLVDRELEKQNINVVRKFSLIPEITCDLGELSSVVLNMITNARDAMTPKGGTLTIEIGKKKDNIEMIFSDTGCGIPDSIKSRIFEPFVTTKGALGQSEIPGTGLGLFLSYGIIDRYHGEIKVKSEVGKGSAFTIKIPISKNQEPPALLEPEKKESIFVPQNLNILLVDDEKPICTAVKKFFETKGHSVTTALSGKKGLEIFKKGNFDVILADITMPDMDGVELIAKLKKIDQQTKFIVLTGHITEDKLESAKKAGADQILMKPFRNEELFQAVGRVLSM